METNQEVAARHRLRIIVLAGVLAVLVVGAVVLAPMLLADVRISSADAGPQAAQSGYLYSAAPVFRTELANAPAEGLPSDNLYSDAPTCGRDQASSSY